MIDTSIIRAARRAVFVPAVLCAATLLAGCGASRGAVAAQERPMVAFENTTNGVVRVYLVSGAGEWLLGRVEPAQTAQLALPPGFTNPDEPLSIAAIQIGQAGPLGTRLTGRNSYAVSQPYPLRHLINAKWGISGQQIYTYLNTR